MKPQCIKGDDLMLFNGTTGKSYAFATAHTLTITADTADTSSKDHGLVMRSPRSPGKLQVKTSTQAKASMICLIV